MVHRDKIEIRRWEVAPWLGAGSTNGSLLFIGACHLLIMEGILQEGASCSLISKMRDGMGTQEDGTGFVLSMGAIVESVLILGSVGECGIWQAWKLESLADFCMGIVRKVGF